MKLSVRTVSPEDSPIKSMSSDSDKLCRLDPNSKSSSNDCDLSQKSESRLRTLGYPPPWRHQVFPFILSTGNDSVRIRRVRTHGERLCALYILS